MKLSSKAFPFAVVICVALAGCAGPNWTAGHALLMEVEGNTVSGDAESDARPQLQEFLAASFPEELPPRVSAAKPATPPRIEVDQVATDIAAESEPRESVDEPPVGETRTPIRHQRETNASRLPESQPVTSPPVTSPPVTSPPVTTPPATRPPDTPTWKESLTQAIESLEAELAATTSEAEARDKMAARLRLLYLAADRRHEAAEPLQNDEQRPEYWKAQIQALAVLLDAKGPPAQDKRAALALRHLREAADQLAAASSLVVQNLAFVSRVENFGRFTEFPKRQFQPDQEVLLYVEVDNFTVEATPQGFETALEGSYQIVDAAGRRVAEHTFPVEKEVCRRPRRDFFIPYRLYMPKSVPAGDYILQLTIKDVKGDKYGQGSIRFALASGGPAK